MKQSRNMTTFKYDKVFLVISVLYFIVMFFCLYKFGVNIDGEATKYITEANGIINGEPFHNGVFGYFYCTYSIIVSIFIKYSISFILLGVLQIVLSYIAGFLILNLIFQKTQNKFIAFSFFAVYLFCYPIQRWVLYAYTESLHTSFVLIGFYLFIKVLDKFSIKKVCFFLLLLLLILTTRPVGIIFFLTIYVACIFYFYKLNQKKVVSILLVFAIFLTVILLNSPFRYFVNPDSLRRMEVICQVPQNANDTNYTAYNKTGLIGAFNVIKNEIGFGKFIRNGIKKELSFFGLIRPHFSYRNNFFLSIYLLLYPFAILGLLLYKEKSFSLLKVIGICYISITAMGIFVTCDDWSDRFVAPVFPFIILLSVGGFNYGFERLIKINKSRR